MKMNQTKRNDTQRNAFIIGESSFGFRGRKTAADMTGVLLTFAAPRDRPRLKTIFKRNFAIPFLSLYSILVKKAMYLFTSFRGSTPYLGKEAGTTINSVCKPNDFCGPYIDQIRAAEPPNMGKSWSPLVM